MTHDIPAADADPVSQVDERVEEIPGDAGAERRELRVDQGGGGRGVLRLVQVAVVGQNLEGFFFKPSLPQLHL